MLPQNALNKERKIKLRWFITLSTLPLLGVVTAFGLAPHSNLGLPSGTLVSAAITIPKITTGTNSTGSFWHTEFVQRGDTVAELLRRLNVEDAAASDHLQKNSAEAIIFRKLPAGTEIQAETSTDGNLIALRYVTDNGTQTVIEKQAGEFITKTLPAQMEKRLLVRTGEIKTSLYAATDAADMPDAAARQLIDLFSGDIDFHHDLRRGDKFTVLYEMTYSNGALLRTGRIQAAEFINQGTAYRAIYFQGNAQRGDYYTPEGKSVRKAFLRSPIEFSRISSGFTNARFHPVLNTWRAHKGTDFAAPMGSKIKATADGVVTMVGKENGYGNVIMLSHQNRYTTVYGHLSRFAKGLHRGQRVTQGEVIGYVGMTGLATGPHLHYEFRVNGRQHDPLRVALPDARPINAADKAAFLPIANNFIAELAQLRNTNLAQLD